MRAFVVVTLIAAIIGCGDPGAHTCVKCSDAGDAPTVDAAVPVTSGSLMVTSSSAMDSMMPVGWGKASASFVSKASGGAWPKLDKNGCFTKAQFDACVVSECLRKNEGAMTLTNVSDGTIVISGLAQSVTLMPNSDNTYTTFRTQQSLFGGGDTIVFNGDGADAPAFTLSLTAPSRVSLTSPVPSGGSITMDPSSNMQVSWTDGSDAEVHIDISAPYDDRAVMPEGNHDGTPNSDIIVDCWFDADAGMGTVPAGAFVWLPLNLPNGAVFSAWSQSTGTTTIGNWEIDAVARFIGVWSGDMSVAYASVELP